EALDLINRSLAVNPEDGHALNDRGMVLAALARPEAALESYHQAGRVIPGDPDLLNNRGSTLCALGRYQEALECFDGALAVSPRDGDIITNRGNALYGLERHNEALECFDRALDLIPNDAELLNSRGNALHGLRRYQEALESYDRALAARPAYADALSNRGNVLGAMERFDAALESYGRALAMAPDLVSALFNRGLTLQETNHREQAIADFERVQELEPDYDYISGWIHQMRAHCCDWQGIGGTSSQIISLVQAAKRAATPWHFFAISDSPGEQLVCAQTWVKDTCPPATVPISRGERYDHDRIRLAYVSADFHNHPTSYLTVGLFEHHDRSRFETIAISLGPNRRRGVRIRLEKAFDRFIDARLQSDRDIALLLRDMEVDIAIDLKGFTHDSRPGILAHRPAPVQVNYLAYPGTMGAPYIDYIIADRFVIPEADQRHYAEQVVYLPDSYQANDSRRPISDHSPSRAEAGLPGHGFVFCCFNNNYKLTPAMFDIWMGLLAEIEGSVLWLLESNDASARNLRHEAERRGVAAERLVFASRAPNPDHLARHRRADLCLDTLPFNAHTTASDALWAGLPIVTCIGTTFAGRVTAGLLNAVGLPELVTDSLDQYAALALNLARDRDALEAIREKLARNIKTEPLYDTDLYRRHLEAAYHTMWQRHQRGEPPKGFTVEKS
ncbi:MAG: tetratricopeptide repeat protein, partial [Alphaproteobacteria bacterium]